jgi:ParB family transcriptional regulator, chromosome partitioning protein
MAGWKNNEAARVNRLASMTDNRPAEPSLSASSRTGQFQGRTALREACSIRLDRIERDPTQPRTEFDPDSLERLAASLKARGQLQPIRVRWEEAKGVYVIVLGERRWRAAQIAGMESVACVVISGSMTAEEILEDQLIENCLRQDLRPIEQARAYQSLMHRLELSQRALAEKLNISQGQVMQSLRLLDLPEAVRESIDAGVLAPTVGYQIAQIPDPEQQQAVAAEVVASGLTRAETVERVRQTVKTSRSPKSRGASKSRSARSRVFRLTTGKATLELKGKVSGTEVMLALAEELVSTLRAEIMSIGTQDAA